MNKAPFPHAVLVECEIFCRVIDNYGDAAVCWRLARQLALEHGWRIRLWLDDLAPLRQLAPDYAAGPVEVIAWGMPPLARYESNVVIEAFGCDLPEDKINAMATQSSKPVWLNLDYLSAESWVADFHGKDSPHPRLPLTKQFFFPGFDRQTGGLLREQDYQRRQQAFDPAAFRTEFQLPPPLPDELTISLFSYPNPALPGLLETWSDSDRPIRLLLPGNDQTAWTRGHLHAHPLPFLPQQRYDEVLWASDLNFVRGEDSFVRAQWAAKPLVWHIYPQDEAAHLVKLDAFLARYVPVDSEAVVEEGAIAATHRFWHAWNGDGRLDWLAFAAHLPSQKLAAQHWATTLSEQPDLASTLVQFCLERIK